MRRTFFTIAVGVLVGFVFSTSLSGQQTTGTSSQASLYLQRSYSQLVGNVSIADVTLTGSVRRIAGSDDESGSATLKAVATGSARADFSLSSGTLSEIDTLGNSGPVGTWSGPDGKSHVVPFHNLLSEPAWFFPTFAISRRLADGYIVTDLGAETHEGQQVEHISVTQNSLSISSANAALFQHLTEVDFFLDSTTLLPTAIAFNIHPDDNALLDIPVEIRFSDYRLVSGSRVPFHVQKFLNNCLFLDVQIQSVAVNSGLSATSFSL
jgi:hypothetical protein